MAIEPSQQGIWLDKSKYDEAEAQMYLKQNNITSGTNGGSGLGTLASQIAKARENIQSSLERDCPTGGSGTVSHEEFTKLTESVQALSQETKCLRELVKSLEQTVKTLQIGAGSGPKTETKNVPVKEQKKEEAADDDDDDIDLFGSDDEEEDAEAARVREDRLKAYAEKKSKKPGPIAKSSVLLDCKPWDDETDMAALETEVRRISMDGLVWGAGKLVPLAYGIKKLSILCIVEDDKVSIDDLVEKIESLEDFVQSVDIGAFNKI